MKNENYGSHWAPAGNYGKPLANCPGMGAGRMGGAPGSYASASEKSGNPHARPGRKIANSPGKGSGRQSNRPTGGKSGIMGGSNNMNMGRD